MRGNAISAWRSNWKRSGVTVETFDDMTIHHPEEMVTLTGRPYQVFTAFKKAWLALPKPAADEVDSAA